MAIRTPEGIVFPLVLADPISRFLALAIDQACIYLASTVIGSVLKLLGIVSFDLAGALVLVSAFVISTGYPMACEWLWRGQTIGKKTMHIRVMDDQGLRLKFSQIVVRNLLRIVDALPGFYMVGGVSSFLNAQGKRLGDIAANTIVVHQTRGLEPDLEQLAVGKFNSFRDYPHLAARLRQNTTLAETRIAVEAVLRRETLDPDRRLVLFSEVRARLEDVVLFPPEATEGLSDEQYIRNVLDIVLR